MCDGLRTEKSDFIKALDAYISARIRDGIKNYHYRKGDYDFLAKPGEAIEACPTCGKPLRTGL